MSPRISLAVSLLSICLMLGSALLARDALAVVVCLGGTFSGMAVSTALYRIAFPELETVK